MKGLWKYISPFSPDQSGVSAVLYGLGGIIIVCDAGGCAGNICGFDEPRWFGKKSAVFSAGLRDMDAILGRDDKLVDKLCLVAADIEAKFAAIIGTPVPAVIGTDYKALRHMAENRLHLPVLTIDSTGMNYYDKGEEKTYMELFKTFVTEKQDTVPNRIGVIGASPLDLSHANSIEALRNKLKDLGYEDIFIYGDGSIEDIKLATTVSKNLVISPAGLKSARYLERIYQIPYEVTYPLLEEDWDYTKTSWENKRVLIVHQQVLANELRYKLLSKGAKSVTVASWFILDNEIKEEQDIALKEEDDFVNLVKNNDFDIIIGDAFFERATKGFTGTYLDFPHFAVSGRV